jgi:hypothetical protein
MDKSTTTFSFEDLHESERFFLSGQCQTMVTNIMTTPEIVATKRSLQTFGPTFLKLTTKKYLALSAF